MAVPFDLVSVFSTEDMEQDDYRPARDNAAGVYKGKGALGGYAPPESAYDSPSEVRYMSGYGATEADLRRGYVEPTITADPAYDLRNYRERSSQPRVPDEGVGESNSMAKDFAFRNRNRRSKGFLTRPALPTERN